MREYLFRGQRVDTKEWVEGFLTIDPTICEYVIDTVGSYSIPVIPETVGQFTGLYDKNDKKIFEGDVVRHHNDNPYNIAEKGQVYWDDTFCGWRRTSNGVIHSGRINTYRMSNGCCYEVIGNIHDTEGGAE